MNKKLLAIIFFSAPLATWAAGGSPLDIKTGLWEITHTTETSGVPPIPADVLAQMPPERRAQMEKMMQHRQDQGPKTRVSKSCITQDKLDKPFNENEDRDEHCKHTIVKQTSTTQDVHFDCSDEDKQRMTSGDFHLQAIDREHVKGMVKVNSSAEEHAMKMNMEMAGKWLGSDCGTTKN